MKKFRHIKWLIATLFLVFLACIGPSDSAAQSEIPDGLPLYGKADSATTTPLTDITQLRQAVGLPDDPRGNSLARLLFLLGYTGLENWKINLASLRVAPDEDGLPLPVLRNQELQAVAILHETAEARRAWREITETFHVTFSGRFNWSAELMAEKPEGNVILRHGAEPYHLAEEHFHHQFSRANLLRLKDESYVSPDRVPRAGDSEAYAATMAHRFLSANPEFAEWTWAGQADIAGLFKDLETPEFLGRCLEREIDLVPLTYPSPDRGDGKPQRPARSLGLLQMSEFDMVGISRFPSSLQLSWDKIYGGDIPWNDMDITLTGTTPQDLNEPNP